ncbi:MAG: amidohydrolase family protein [Bacteroidales bacterium]|nr:amidohydrolase family protein [Bacteroidales bacterium]
MIDAHHHLWVYNDRDYNWMDESMGILKRDYLPCELQEEMKKSGFSESVVVQARQTVEETDWLLDVADSFEFIKGVVGWVDLLSDEAKDQLGTFSSHPKFSGVRHVIHDEPDPGFMLRDDFAMGIAAMGQYDLAYDLLLFPRHLPNALQLVQKFKNQRFVIDHLSKPNIKKREIEPWKTDITRMAANPNVWCKISGLVTEADHSDWNYLELVPYLDIVVEAFGTGRLMTGSDWPVCRLAGEYADIMSVPFHYFASFTEEEKDQVFRSNAIDFYNLKKDQVSGTG